MVWKLTRIVVKFRNNREAPARTSCWRPALCWHNSDKTVDKPSRFLCALVAVCTFYEFSDPLKSDRSSDWAIFFLPRELTREVLAIEEFTWVSIFGRLFVVLLACSLAWLCYAALTPEASSMKNSLYKHHTPWRFVFSLSLTSPSRGFYAISSFFTVVLYFFFSLCFFSPRGMFVNRLACACQTKLSSYPLVVTRSYRRWRGATLNSDYLLIATSTESFMLSLFRAFLSSDEWHQRISRRVRRQRDACSLPSRPNSCRWLICISRIFNDRFFFKQVHLKLSWLENIQKMLFSSRLSHPTMSAGANMA